MLGVGLPAVDLSALLQLVLTALALLFGALLLVKNAASRYFVVDDATFEPGEDYEARHRMSIGGAGDGEATAGGPVPGFCVVCQRPATKKCSRCKSVRYCSQACQTKHWENHKLKCKQARLSDKLDTISPNNDACRRRKPSGFNSISLVPARGTCKVLQEPKKILFPYDEFLMLFNWDKPGFPPCGLLNCGNSCFANVVLQCLACTRPLLAFLLEKDHSRKCIRKQNDWCFLCELQVHIRRASESLHPFSPINILSRLPNIGGNLGYGRQEDAHEFMRFAIDTMQSVCLDEFGGENALDPSTQETTLIHHIFGGHLQSQVICTKCNMISNRYENMMDLTVEIQGDAESLEECLDQFTMKEWLDGENMYKCDGCNDYVRAWKRLTIHQAPNILTIALKRFQSGRFGKLNKRVTFPEHLDLTPYMSGNGDGTDLYTLYAVVVHLDMLNASFFGHYICYTKDYRGRWYRIDDCKVMNVEVEEVLAQGAYMLLYSRRNARQEPYIKPTEPPMKKPLVVDPEASNIIGETKPVSVHCLPSHDVSRSSLPPCEVPIDVSLPWHKRNLSIKSSTMDETDLEDMCLDIPNHIKPTCVSKDLGDLEFDDFKPSLLGPKDLEEGKSSISRLLEDISSFKPVRSTSISPTENSSIKVQAIEVKPTIVPEDSGDMDIDYAEPSSLESEDLEEGRPNIAPRVTADTSSVKPTRPHFVSPEEISSVEVQTSEVKPPHIPKDLGDSDVDDSGPSLSGPSDLEEAISSTSPRELENISSVKRMRSNSISSGKVSVEVPEDFGDYLEERKLRLSPRVQEDVSFFKPVRSDFVSPAGISPIEVQTMGSQEPLVSSDADNCMIEDTGSVSSIEESFKLSKYTPGGSFSSVHNIAETSSRASIASSSTAPEQPAYDSRPNLEQVVTACSPSDSTNGIERPDSVSSASKGARTPSCRENGFRGDSKPLFSRGFLDRPARKESVVCKDRTQRGNCAVAPAPKVNGRINGYAKPVFTVQNIPDNGVVLELLSSNSNGKDDRLGPRKNFIYPGFLSKSYKQPVNDDKIAKREFGTKTKCNGFAEQACVRQADEEDYRPVIGSSDKGLLPGTALANGNGIDGAAGSIR